MNKMPNMSLDVIEAIKDYYQDDEETAINCLLFLSHLCEDKENLTKLADEVEYYLQKQSRCLQCGADLQVRSYKEYHPELYMSPTEEIMEVYCPNCDIDWE